MRAFSRIDSPHQDRTDLHNLNRVWPYVWRYRGRVLAAMSCLLAAKLAMVGVPLVLKQIVDWLDQSATATTAVPLALLLAYGVLRLAGSAFNELRDVLFARVRYAAMRRLSQQVLEHLHQLALRFHLERHTGNISRDLERGTQSVSSTLNYLVFNILPTAAEFLLVAAILLGGYATHFAAVVFVTVFVYVGFTLSITEWRMHYRHTMNRLDSQANGRAIDSLLNYETVKYFTNEAYELNRYQATLGEWEDAAVKSQTTMSLLNIGQGLIIAVGVTAVMIYAAAGVAAGDLTLGDLVLINTMMLQLFLPLNFLGVIYRALKYALADMDLVFKLLDRDVEIRDADDALYLPAGPGRLRFRAVQFHYAPDRPILHDIDFEVAAGQKVAVVGPSGAGKSTLARLLFRFYDVTAGAIEIDGYDLRQLRQSSLRSAIGIVPQDTVLFNDSIAYNIRYADPEADDEAVIRAARMADLHTFIESLPQGYETMVGERGLKLSGGEKQRLAIARVILKRPRVLVFDEATSSLDSRSEQAILAALHAVSRDTTTLVIAHRLSTVVDADTILVMEAGRLVERGSHAQLLDRGGLYAHLWSLQQKQREAGEPALASGI